MKTKIWLTIFMIMILSVALCAQTENKTEGVKENQEVAQKDEVSEKKVNDATPLFLWSIIIGGLAITVAAVFGAFAQSKALRTASESMGRNPAAADSIRGILILGLALIESLVIYVLLIDLIIFFIKWGKYQF